MRIWECIGKYKGGRFRYEYLRADRHELLIRRRARGTDPVSASYQLRTHNHSETTCSTTMQRKRVTYVYQLCITVVK